MYNTIMDSWNPHVRAWRISRGLTQASLADISGLRQASISRWEDGKMFPRRAALARLASALGTTVESLFSRPNSSQQGFPRAKADRLAKAVVSGTYPKDEEESETCLNLALWFGEKLKAQNAPGWEKISRKHLHSVRRPLWIKQQYHKALLDQMLWRIDKALSGGIA